MSDKIDKLLGEESSRRKPQPIFGSPPVDEILDKWAMAGIEPPATLGATLTETPGPSHDNGPAETAAGETKLAVLAASGASAEVIAACERIIAAMATFAPESHGDLMAIKSASSTPGLEFVTGALTN